MQGFLILLTFLAMSGPALGESRTVVFPDFRGRDEERVFAYAVLKEALFRAGPGYNLVKADTGPMTNARAIEALDNGRVDVLWVGTSKALEARFRPVYIPITRGLLGQRLFVINAARQADFDEVENLDDLRAFTAGQGIGWEDTRILRAAGLEIVTETFDNLFRLTNADRIDFYPLGASEIHAFVSQYKGRNPNIAVEQNLILSYRFDFLFFVRQDNARLAEAIRRGIEAMYADGTYLRMFRTHPELKAVWTQANLGGRRRIEIPNPLISKEMERIPARYWMSGS